MLYQGSKLTVTLEEHVAELCFNAQDGSVNKFDHDTLQQLEQAVDLLEQEKRIQGLVITSGKDSFIVGADIMEFGARFQADDKQLHSWLIDINKTFSRIEDLPYPVVAAINGLSLGGGMELCLTADYRVLAESARVGQPETQLGIIPGFGGTVRLPRLIGADNAIEWIATGKQYKAAAALAVGAVDAVVADDQVQAAARDLLQRAMTGEFTWEERAEEKKRPLHLNLYEAAMAFHSAKGYTLQKTKGQYPAPIAAIDVITEAAGKKRTDALDIERKAFIRMAKSPEANALIGLFLNDQLIKKKSKAYRDQAHEIEQAAVLGAGVMGGGIAYQSASKGLPVLMKDINAGALQKGLDELTALASKGVKRGKLSQKDFAQTLSRVQTTLNYGDFDRVNAVIEAVSENPQIKQKVLAETENHVAENTVLASNTSSIAISELAKGLKRPENFLGMHFFNPVHRMPLVEVIQGKQTSPEAVATTVALAQRLGKTPIVVKDCPGFLVNRILFPYFFGFMAMLEDGVNFEHIDAAMEKFGWPMGPAYLSDVVGMDVAMHVGQVLARGYPDRMAHQGKNALDIMVANKRLGQKNGRGYYRYELDKKGREQKLPDETAHELLAPLQKRDPQKLEPETIVDRMMLPMVIEAARCLEQGIVETPNELDMAMVLGTGFPPFRGGPLKYADQVGLAKLCEKAEQYQHLGKLYEPTENMRERAKTNQGYYSQA